MSLLGLRTEHEGREGVPAGAWVAVKQMQWTSSYSMDDGFPVVIWVDSPPQSAFLNQHTTIPKTPRSHAIRAELHAGVLEKC